MAVAALAGVTRGFSGFGGAMVYMPLIAAIYDPRIAAVTILLVDFVSATPFAIPEVPPLHLARGRAALGRHGGRGCRSASWLLIVLDPIVLRWFIAALVLEPCAGAGVGLALSRRAAPADHRRRRPVRGRRPPARC